MRAKWEPWSNHWFSIIETAQALNVPNDIAAQLWICVNARSSLTLYEFRTCVRGWNVEVQKQLGLGPNDAKKGRPQFGQMYVRKLKEMLSQWGDALLVTGGRVSATEINDIDECVEWPAVEKSRQASV